jgi:hypothetical protein
MMITNPCSLNNSRLNFAIRLSSAWELASWNYIHSILLNNDNNSKIQNNSKTQTIIGNSNYNTNSNIQKNNTDEELNDLFKTFENMKKKDQIEYWVLNI